ncbi:MAG: signal recognition particle receptor subunit alpha [Candidatus Pacearchaeota archaeon]
MLEKLGNTLKKARDKLANAVFLDKNMVDQIVRDLQRALIEADVNVKLVKQITDKIKKEALDERIKDVEKKEHLVKLLYDELVKILGESKELELEKGQNRIMLLGLYGAGKTTTIAKLGNYYSKRGKKVALVGLDVHRPAAKEQLQQLGNDHNMDVFVDMEKDNAVETWKEFEEQGKFENYDLVLVDTAGRHTLDEDLVKEVENLDKTVKPTEKILVMPADIGQAAKKQSEEFQNSLDISGVIITKMDSTAKAGGALTACYETGAGIYFITTGEKVNDIESFDPEAFLSRVLGMGDLKSLLEKVQSASDSGKQQEIQERLQEGKITLDDVIEQVKSMSSMGGMSKLKSMIPGMGKANIPDGELESQENKVQKWQHIVNSMTKYERENPDVFEKETSRIRRVANGSGVNRSELRALLKQYKMLKEMVKDTSMSGMDPSQGMSQKQLQKMMKKFSKGKFRM